MLTTVPRAAPCTLRVLKKRGARARADIAEAVRVLHIVAREAAELRDLIQSIHHPKAEPGT